MVLVMVALTSLFFLVADVVISWLVRSVLGFGQ
jgi:preprotein translocase subunit SecE